MHTGVCQEGQYNTSVLSAHYIYLSMPHESVGCSYHFWILNFRVQLGAIDFCITPVHFYVYINIEHKQR